MQPWKRRQPTGAEPSEARSALGLRRWLSGVAVVCGVMATVVFGGLALRGGDDARANLAVAIVALGVSVIAVVDLVWLRGRHY